MKATCLKLCLACSIALSFSGAALAQTATAETDAKVDRAAVIADGVEYLRTAGQAADGTFTAQAGPGLTAARSTDFTASAVAVWARAAVAYEEVIRETRAK